MNIQTLIKIGFISQVGLVFALSMNTASAAKLYKWVDDQGRISYQDKPPPENSKILSEKTLKDKTKSDDNAVNITPIDVYVTKSCPSCDQMLEILDDWGVPYTEKAIDEHRAIQTQLLELTDGINVPALFNDGDYLRNTNSEGGLRESLEQTGHLTAESNKTVDPVKAN